MNDNPSILYRSKRVGLTKASLAGTGLEMIFIQSIRGTARIVCQACSTAPLSLLPVQGDSRSSPPFENLGSGPQQVLNP